MKSRADLFLLLAVAAPILAFACAWIFAPPILNPDSATGFRVWESMRAGGPWNSVVGPDPADIARDYPVFITWWSPGQYVFPGLLRTLGLTWCHAALLTTLASMLLGVWAVWHLGKRLGLDPKQGALACLLVSVAGGTLHGFGMFWGGDILLLAATPFVYLSALRVRDLPPLVGAARFFFACLLALFCKHGAVVVIAGSLFFLATEVLRESGPRILRDRRLWLASAAAGLAFLCSRLLWIRGGPTPGDAGQVPHSILTGFAFALNGPWFVLTGAGSLASWLFQRGGLETTGGWTRFAPWLLASGIAGTALVVFLGIRRDGARVWRLAACAWLATAGLLAFLYFRGASVSMDDRHLRPAVAPLALALASAALPSRGGRAAWRFAALALVFGSLAFGVASHVRRVSLLAALPRGAVSGFTQPDLPAETREVVAAMVPPGATLVLTSPSQAFEFPGRRVLASDAFSRPADELARWRFAGAPSPLAVAGPASFETDGRAPLLRAAFVDVPTNSWRVVDAGNWHLWLASPTPAATEP